MRQLRSIEPAGDTFAESSALQATRYISTLILIRTILINYSVPFSEINLKY